jgi:OmpA-OmpF porin, OOP family
MKGFARLLLSLCTLFALPACVAWADADAAGCKDSPLVGRFPGSVITRCEQKADDSFTFKVGSTASKAIEGNYLRLEYNFPKSASKTQVVRNMNSAMKSAKYTFDYDSGDYGDFTVHSGKTWIQIEISGGGSYKETIVVEGALAQMVTAHLPDPASGGAAGAAAAKPEKPDAAGCKDSPLLGRFPGSYIDACSQKADDSFEFTMGNGKPKKKLEGRLLQIQYDYPKTASKAQVVRNMNTALKNAGYTFDYDSGDYGDFTVHMGKTWMQVEISGGNWYKETIVTETALTQDVVASAAALSTGLQATGHMVVTGILFDTGKADVKPESGPALEQVVKLLQGDPKLKLYVVGHTDSVGVLASNLDLSHRRAEAVVQMLITQYKIAAGRLSSFGDGPYAPRASNDSEDGRALNRRVELVKQ